MNSTTFLLRTGSTPGIPRQTGQVWVLGAPPNFVEQPQNIFASVRSWAWTSSPMTGSYSITGKGSFFLYLLVFHRPPPLAGAAPPENGPPGTEPRGGARLPCIRRERRSP